MLSVCSYRTFCDLGRTAMHRFAAAGLEGMSCLCNTLQSNLADFGRKVVPLLAAVVLVLFTTVVHPTAHREPRSDWQNHCSCRNCNMQVNELPSTPHGCLYNCGSIALAVLTNPARCPKLPYGTIPRSSPDSENDTVLPLVAQYYCQAVNL